MEPSSKVQQEYKLPRIHKGLKIVELREEAFARGLDGKSLPKKKSELLEHLVDGSVHLKLAFEEIRSVLESELDVLQAENKGQGENVVTKAASTTHSQELGVAQATGSAMNEATAAKSNEEKQQKRVGGTTSKQAGTQQKKLKLVDQIVPKHVRQEMQAALAKEFSPSSYESKQFTENVTNPPSTSKKFVNQLGFTVWCNAGEEDDPSKDFDTTWSTKEEANLRAKYLFYWDNCWGIPPKDMMHDSRFEVEISIQGLLSLEVEPVDSGVWRVGVLPDAVFERMDYTSTLRYDDEDGSDCTPLNKNQDYCL